MEQETKRLRRRDLKLPEVADKDASGEVREIYDRIKDRMRSSVVTPPWRAFAAKPKFLAAVWDEVEPALDEGFMEAAEGIRALAVERVRETAPVPDHRALLEDDLARAVEELRVFLEVNPRTLILLSALRRSWAGGEVSGAREAVETEHGVPRWHPQVETASSPAPQTPLTKTYQDIVTVLDLPAPGTDFEVLAKWPDYLDRAWADLRSFVGMESWRDICRTVDWVAEQAGLALPSPVRISPDRGGEIGLDETETEDVGRWIEAFHSMLPSLIVNTSYLWIGMHGGISRLPAPGVEGAEQRAPEEAKKGT